MENVSTPITNSIAKISEAMSKAQSQIQVAVFDKQANYGPYASFKSVREASIQALTDNGLSIFQPVNFDGTNYYLETILSHSSGEFIKSSIQLMIDRKNMQGLGSAITYAKRYAWASILGIVSDDDDDGAEASKTEIKNEEKPKQQSKPVDKKPKQDNTYYPPAQVNAENKKRLLKDLAELVSVKRLNKNTYDSFVRLHSKDGLWHLANELSEEELSAIIDDIKQV